MYVSVEMSPYQHGPHKAYINPQAMHSCSGDIQLPLQVIVSTFETKHL